MQTNCKRNCSSLYLQTNCKRDCFRCKQVAKNIVTVANKSRERLLLSQTSSITYDINYGWTNHCQLLPEVEWQNNTKFNQVTTQEEFLHDDGLFIQAHCVKRKKNVTKAEHYIHSELKSSTHPNLSQIELIAVLSHRIACMSAILDFQLTKATENQRFKRDTLTDIALDVKTANVISNLISTVVEFRDLNSSTNRIDRFESSLQTMKHNFDISKEVTEVIIDQLDVISNKLQEQIANMEKLATTYRRLSWMAAIILHKILTNSADLREVTEQVREGSVATSELSRMLNIIELRNIDRRVTHSDSVTGITDNQLNMKFSIRRSDQHSKVYQIHPFDFWDDIAGTPKLMRYNG